MKSLPKKLENEMRKKLLTQGTIVKTEDNTKHGEIKHI